jgi:hypothetical protein
MRPTVDEPISPELVLVDPELARRVRQFAVAGPEPASAQPEALPERPSPEPPAPAIEASPPPADLLLAEPAPAAPPPQLGASRPTTRRRRPKVSTSIASLVGLSLLGAAFLPPRDAPILPGAPSRSDVAQAAPLTLSWRASGTPDYYLVELLRDGALVHATSVRPTHLALPAWLRPGRYSWRIYAGTGPPAKRQVRGPVEEGWIRVAG